MEEAPREVSGSRGCSQTSSSALPDKAVTPKVSSPGALSTESPLDDSKPAPMVKQIKKA